MKDLNPSAITTRLAVLNPSLNPCYGFIFLNENNSSVSKSMSSLNVSKGYSKNSLACCRHFLTDIRLAKIVCNWLFFFLPSSSLYPFFRRQLFWLKRPPHLFFAKRKCKKLNGCSKIEKNMFFPREPVPVHKSTRLPFSPCWFLICGSVLAQVASIAHFCQK